MARLRSAPARAAAAAVVAVTAGAGAMGGTFAAFNAQSDSAANVVTAAPDFVAPAVARTVVAKAAGGTPGFVKQGGSYHVYAQVSDSGNPASGVASVTANVSALTPAGTAVPLSAGSFTVGGQSYNRRSAALTAAAALVPGSTAYSVATADVAGNTRTNPGTVTVDNTLPTGADIQTANGSTTAGRAQQGDTITYTFSEPIEPESVLSGWSGAATDVVVAITDGGLLGLGGNDDLVVRNSAGSAELPLGRVVLGRTDYMTGGVLGVLGGEIRFGATGTKSSMAMSGNAITITLGTYSTPNGGDVATAGGNGTMTWTPALGPYDRAANGVLTTPAGESGAGDREF